MGESSLLWKIGGTVVALVVLAVGLKLGCGSCGDDPMKAARDEMFDIGCARAGHTRTDTKFVPCMKEAREKCTMGDEAALRACQADARSLRYESQGGGASMPTCLALIDCAKSVGTTLR